MQISNNNIQKNNQKSFKGFFEASAGVQQNAVLNRAILESSFIPWALQSNNKHERRERLLGPLLYTILAFVVPILNVPAANRIFMRVCGLTDGLGDTNHKAIQLSNKYLTSAENTIEGLKKYNKLNDAVNNPKISERFFTSPLEKLFLRMTGGKEVNTVNIEALLKKCGNNPEILRKRLSGAKNLTLCSDLLITCFTLGFFEFLNHHITKKISGRSGFSAELNMADEKIITERAKKYEENKKKYMKWLSTGIVAASAIVPFIVHKGLTSQNNNKFTNFIKKHANLCDYTKGIYMSRFILLFGTFANIAGLLLASRNNTERKDWLIRLSITNPIYFGGDLLALSLLSNVSDKIFKTKLVKPEQKKGIFRKIFPSIKSMEQIGKEVAQNKIGKGNKKAAIATYWGSLGVCAGILAYAVPAISNRMIKHDVDEYVKKSKEKEKDITFKKEELQQCA